jgi:2-polyprenyl-6-methoxyphenol hydroxylase-like FAD-dependent oxidoreductase
LTELVKAIDQIMRNEAVYRLCRFGGRRWCSTSADERRRVIISGAGPTGLTSALLLAKYGVPSVVLERSSSLPNHPKAHCINQRTMEVFRGMPLDALAGRTPTLADRVRQAMPPIDEWRSFVYCSGSLLDESSLLGVVDHFKTENNLDPFRFSPEPVAHLPQHRLVPMLAEMCRRSDMVDVRMGCEAIEFEQGENGVRVRTARDDALSGSFLIAADGAHSMVRKSLGIQMDGPGTLQHLINIYFTAPSLARELKAVNRMGMLYFVFGASHVVVLVAHDLGRGEFVAQVPFFPPLQGAHSFGREVCKNIIGEIAGGAHEAMLKDVVVHDTKPWAMAAAVATRYRDGHIFLAGDAAHVVPPAGAFGMNTGVQDAHNLAWKLAVALSDSGRNAECLLNSYDAERRPIAIANMNLSVDNFHEALEVARVIGLDFSTAQSVNSLLSSGPMASLVSESTRRQMLGAAMSSGLWMGRALAKARQRELKDLFDSGRTLRLQYPKEDIGFAYQGRGCYVNVESDLKDALRKAVRPKPRDEPFVEGADCFLPGKRFPHFFMTILEDERSVVGLDSPVSSIDVPAAVGTDFVLFCSGSSASTWKAQAQGKGITVVGLVSGDEDCEHVKTNENATDNGSHDVRYIHAEARGSLWNSLMDRGKDTGVLVRPDGHIYWVGKTAQWRETLTSISEK